eukprot:scaffold28505_cov132-Isochrysis_galbana.AAC.2
MSGEERRVGVRGGGTHAFDGVGLADGSGWRREPAGFDAREREQWRRAASGHVSPACRADSGSRSRVEKATTIDSTLRL